MFRISLKGTFMVDVKRAESLSHFPCTVAPSSSGKENLALTRAPGCRTVVSTLSLQGSPEGQYLARVGGRVLHCTFNYIFVALSLS